MSKNDVTKFDIAIKTIVQIAVVILEVGGIGVVTAIVCNIIAPTTNWIEHISRFFIGSSIYELLVFCISTQIVDARKDALLSLKTAYKYGELFFETGQESIKYYVLKMIQEQLNPGIFNHVDIRNKYKELQKYIDTNNFVALKFTLIHIEHCYEEEELKWKYSILLKFLK